MKQLLYLKDDQLKDLIEKIFISYRETFSDSKEILEKLSKYKPENLNEAGKISGMTPSALFQIVKHKKVKGSKVA